MILLPTTTNRYCLLYQVCDYLNEEMDGAGSTGAIAIYDGRKHVFTVANVGDSMCVLSRGGKAVMLNRMHRLDNEEERERVRRAGGTIINSRWVPPVVSPAEND